MLRELTLENFKSFKRETIRFAQSGMTVLVGPNGSGKSSVLDGAFYAAFSFEPGLPAMPSSELVRAGEMSFKLHLHATGGVGSAGCEVVFDKKRSVAKWVEASGVRHYLWDELGGRQPTANAPFDVAQVASVFPAPRVLAVNFSALRHPLRGASLDVAVFGERQVVQILFDLKLGTDTNAFNRTMAKLSRVVPAVKSFGISRASVEGDKDAYGLKFNMSTGADIPASQVSEGTLFALAIIAAAELTLPAHAPHHR